MIVSLGRQLQGEEGGQFRAKCSACGSGSVFQATVLPSRTPILTKPLSELQQEV